VSSCRDHRVTDFLPPNRCPAGMTVCILQVPVVRPKEVKAENTHLLSESQDLKLVEKQCPGVSTVWSTAVPLHSHKMQNGEHPSLVPVQTRRKKTLVYFLSLKFLQV